MLISTDVVFLVIEVDDDVDIYFNRIKLDIVDCFKYLCITFYKNGNWFRTQKLISQYGNFALHKLVSLFESIYLPITEKCKLFDCLVESVLSYGSEVWGFHECKDIENDCSYKILLTNVMC